MAWITDELVDQTRRVWSPHYGRLLTEDEAVEILTNVKRFADVLLKARREGNRDAERRHLGTGLVA